MRSLAFVLGCWMVMGCSADEPPDPLRNASGFCEAWSDRVCTQDIVEVCASPSVEKCRAAQTDDCLERVEEDLYTARDAKACLDAVSNALLDSQLNLKEYKVLKAFGEPCDKLLSGKGTTEDACESDLDCSDLDGLVCVKAQGSQEGKCYEPDYVSGGGKCDDDNDVCQQGYYCDGEHCIARLEVDDECDAQNPCEDDLLCGESGDGGVSRCLSKLEAGEECLSNNECADGLCSLDKDSEDGVCTKRIVLTALAAECVSLR